MLHKKDSLMHRVTDISPQRPTSRRPQAGFTMMELLLSLMITALVGVGAVMMMNSGSSLDRDMRVAREFEVYSRAVVKYTERRLNEYLTTTPPSGFPVLVTRNDLINDGLLPASAPTVSLYDQEMVGYIRRIDGAAPDNNHQIEILVATRPGPSGFATNTRVNGIQARRMATELKAPGGFVNDTGALGIGSYGGWQVTMTDFTTGTTAPFPGENDILYYTYLTTADTQMNVQNALYRVRVPGFPQANRMHANLNMNGFSMTEIDDLETVTVGAGVPATQVNTLDLNIDEDPDPASAAIEPSDRRNSSVRVGAQAWNEARLALVNALYGGQYRNGSAGRLGGGFGEAGDTGPSSLDIQTRLNVNDQLIVEPTGRLVVENRSDFASDLEIYGEEGIQVEADTSAENGLLSNHIAEDWDPCTSQEEGRLARTSAGRPVICFENIWRDIEHRNVDFRVSTPSTGNSTLIVSGTDSRVAVQANCPAGYELVGCSGGSVFRGYGGCSPNNCGWVYSGPDFNHPFTSCRTYLDAGGGIAAFAVTFCARVQ